MYTSAYIYVCVCVSSKKENLYTATICFFFTNSEILESK